MTSYASFAWRCLSCSATGVVWPSADDTPPSNCPTCGSSEIEYPYQAPTEDMDPIPELEGTQEQQLDALLDILAKENNELRMLKIAGLVAELRKDLGTNSS